MIIWTDFFSYALKALRNWWGDWWNQALMNLLWIVSTVTIIFAPTATLAMYQQNKRVAEGGVASAGDMFRSYRSWFLLSWQWLLSNVVALFVLTFAFRFYGTANTTWGVGGMIVVTILMLIWGLLQVYTLPMLMWQDNHSLTVAWRNSFALIVQAPLFSIIFLIFTIIVWILSAASGVFAFFGGVGLASVLGCQVVYGRLQKMFPDEFSEDAL